MRTSRYPPGTRVRVRRGPFPLDPSTVGRSGFILRIRDERPGAYDVVLDGEGELRTFSEEELEPELPGPGPSAGEGGAGAPGPGPVPTGS